MRTITFRFYDVQNTKMIYPHTRSGGSFRDLEETLYWKVMQYTGVDDVHGTRIYEGDLFKQLYPAGYSIFEVRFGIYDNEEEYEGHVYGNGWYFVEHAFYRSNDQEETSIRSFYLEGQTFPRLLVGNIYQHRNILKPTETIEQLSSTEPSGKSGEKGPDA